MATIPNRATTTPRDCQIEYPTSDGRPMGETDLHRRIMVDAIAILLRHFAGQPIYVSGNLLLFYQRGDKRRHVSPDVMVVKGLVQCDRDHYLLWEERLAPNVVIEVTSASTRREDLKKKFNIYRDVVQVAEYFLFDPRGEYLSPTLQGHRLSSAEYVPIGPVSNRLPSVELGLELEDGHGALQFFDPATGRYLLTPAQAAEAKADRLAQELEALRQRIGDR